MKIYTKDSETLAIEGEMKTIEDYTAIKSALSKVIADGRQSINIEVVDSLTITSSIIGLFTKVIHGDGLKLSMTVHSDRLYNLLEDLNLITIFGVKKHK
jgi:hypothetical protein